EAMTATMTQRRKTNIPASPCAALVVLSMTSTKIRPSVNAQPRTCRNCQVRIPRLITSEGYREPSPDSRASGGRSLRLLTCGLGLFGDPREVVRVSVDDRPRGHTGDLVGVIALGAGNDVGHPGPAGVQRYPAFGPLVNLALPGVDRPDRGEVVGA